MKKFLHVLFAATLVFATVQVGATTFGAGEHCCVR